MTSIKWVTLTLTIMSHINSKCKPCGFSPLLLHMASCCFLNADLNLNPVQHLNISLGWGTVYLEVSVEKPGLDVITCATKICSLPQISCVSSDKSFNPLNFFFPLPWFICLQVGMLRSFSKVLQSRPMSCAEGSRFGWCSTGTEEKMLMFGN